MECIICTVKKLLASCSSESVIRFWDFDNSDNYVLDIQCHPAIGMDEVVTTIAYNCYNSMSVA